eukprot:scaffold8509_cov119-Isochrysis_galbana.AAC.6
MLVYRLPGLDTKSSSLCRTRRRGRSPTPWSSVTGPSCLEGRDGDEEEGEDEQVQRAAKDARGLTERAVAFGAQPERKRADRPAQQGRPQLASGGPQCGQKVVSGRVQGARGAGGKHTQVGSAPFGQLGNRQAAESPGNRLHHAQVWRLEAAQIRPFEAAQIRLLEIAQIRPLKAAE